MFPCSCETEGWGKGGGEDDLDLITSFVVSEKETLPHPGWGSPEKPTNQLTNSDAT